MLQVLSQFIMKEAIKSPIYILNPPILLQESITLPRYAVIHYLDTKSNVHFPVKDLYYFKDISPSKKIPVFTVSDLEYKDETTTLENKYAQQEIRKWYQENLKTFRNVDLLAFPNSDTNLISVFNYNVIKDMYKYTTSLLSKHYRYYNLYKTYWSYIEKSLKSDKESIHFASIDLPNNIPNYNLIDIMLKFNTVKFSRIVSDEDLLKIIDLYKWLLEDTRKNSTLSDITDEDSKRIILEIKYKGYSTFLPLHMIRSLCKESKLENTTKVDNNKIHRLFILMLRKIQDKVNGLIESNKIEETSETVLTPENDVLIEVDENSSDSDTDILDSVPSNLTKFNSNNDKDIPKLADISKISDTIEIENITGLIDEAIIKFDDDNSETDRLYEQSIIQAEKESDNTEEAFTVDYSEDKISQILSPVTSESQFNKFIDEAVQFKTLTSTEIRNLKKINENRAILKSPYDPNTKLNDFITIRDEDKSLSKEKIKLNIDNNLIPENLKEDIVKNFDTEYITKTIKKDTIACVSNLEKSGLIIKDYNVEEVKSSVGKYEVHKLTVKPLNGKESTILFRLPKIDSEGKFVSGGIVYKMRKQETDHPIRKISPTNVAITSNYSKLFVFRTDRKANDPYRYLTEYIRRNYIEETGIITKVIPGVKSLNNSKLPNIYHVLSSNFNEIRTPELTLLLNTEDQHNHIDEKTIKDISDRGLIFCGYLNNKHIIVIDKNSLFYDYTNGMYLLGDINKLLKIDPEKIPKAFSTIKILGDNIPLGICMSYYLGLTNLISVTKTQYKLIESNKQYKPENDELVLKFNDYKLILKTDTTDKQLLFNGFLFYKDFIKQHDIKEFDYKEIYLNVFEFRDSGLIHIKELNLLEELFLDPITVDVLRSLNEPTEYLKVLLKANSMLDDLSHPDINDPKYARLRGYDRVPGLMYRALAESIRDFKLKGRSGGKVELDPYKVWNYITQDNTVKITEDINPVLNVKESETVTLSGMDGLNKDATPKALRRFHKNDIGLISEATVDSSDVALNTYLTPYAKIKDTRGIVDIDNLSHKENKGKVFSTSILLAPMAEFDDPKRQNFVNIQNSHSIMSVGYQQPIVRTGYEYVMPFKVSKLYCIMAKEDGQVLDKTDKLLTVKYKDGSLETIKIGTQYGRMEGGVYPHTLVTDLDKGSKFKQNNYLAYNQNFFEKDWLDPSRLIMKFSRNVTVALTMNDEVFEDSSAISKELSLEMSTTVIKEKIFIIDFNKNIINLTPEGSVVDPNTILFTVVDNETDFNNLSESTISLLQNLSALSPKAKYNGVIDRYEVKYNGETSDMSSTLKKLVSRLDKQLYDETKGTEYEATNNRVTSEYRSEGKNLNVDTLELKVFIKIDLKQNTGDKGVFASQMKSVISDVFTSTVTTESGVNVEAMFSMKGILNRIVNSPILIGTTTRLVKHVSKQIADIYFNK